MNNQAPLILTAQMDSESQAYFNDLRLRHFPPERNYLKAHITLFHKLPPDELDKINNTLEQISNNTKQFEIIIDDVIFYGRGTGLLVKSNKLTEVRRELADKWRKYMSRQDQQKFRPHITIQNKVDSQVAREFHEQFKSNWQPRAGQITGLNLWKYMNGPWKLEKVFLFRK